MVERISGFEVVAEYGGLDGWVDEMLVVSFLTVEESEAVCTVTGSCVGTGIPVVLIPVLVKTPVVFVVSEGTGFTTGFNADKVVNKGENEVMVTLATIIGSRLVSSFAWSALVVLFTSDKYDEISKGVGVVGLAKNLLVTSDADVAVE